MIMTRRLMTCPMDHDLWVWIHMTSAISMCSTDTQYYRPVSLYTVPHHVQGINTTLYVLVLLLLLRARGPTSCVIRTMDLLTSRSYDLFVMLSGS